MSNVDTRQLNRDSLFLLAQVRVHGQDQAFRVKVRNLSAGGMMAEAETKVTRGALVLVELRNAGWVEGSVAWVQDNRFGIAFADEVDPALIRGAAAGEEEFVPPRYTRNHQPVPISQRPDLQRLRKI